MTDRELLERAAKAAGVDVIELYGNLIHNTGNQYVIRVWDPLADDGDALRLAVRKRFHVCVFAAYDTDDFKSPGFVEVWHDGDSDPLVMEYVSANDYEAATRRAIVRAAAAIGEQA